MLYHGDALSILRLGSMPNMNASIRSLCGVPSPPLGLFVPHQRNLKTIGNNIFHASNIWHYKFFKLRELGFLNL
jgi:hypothetical protein